MESRYVVKEARVVSEQKLCSRVRRGGRCWEQELQGGSSEPAEEGLVRFSRGVTVEEQALVVFRFEE